MEPKIIFTVVNTNKNRLLQQSEVQINQKEVCYYKNKKIQCNCKTKCEVYFIALKTNKIKCIHIANINQKGVIISYNGLVYGLKKQQNEKTRIPFCQFIDCKACSESVGNQPAIKCYFGCQNQIHTKSLQKPFRNKQFICQTCYAEYFVECTPEITKKIYGEKCPLCTKIFTAEHMKTFHPQLQDNLQQLNCKQLSDIKLKEVEKLKQTNREKQEKFFKKNKPYIMEQQLKQQQIPTQMNDENSEQGNEETEEEKEDSPTPSLKEEEEKDNYDNESDLQSFLDSKDNTSLYELDQSVNSLNSQEIASDFQPIKKSKSKFWLQPNLQKIKTNIQYSEIMNIALEDIAQKSPTHQQRIQTQKIKQENQDNQQQQIKQEKQDNQQQQKQK